MAEEAFLVIDLFVLSVSAIGKRVSLSTCFKFVVIQ